MQDASSGLTEGAVTGSRRPRGDQAGGHPEIAGDSARANQPSPELRLPQDAEGGAPGPPADLSGAIGHIRDLTPDPANRRAHNPRNIGMLVDALHAVGAARSIVIDEDAVVLAGNGVLDAAAEAGITRVKVVDADGSEIVAVRRTGLTPDQKRALAIFDNRTAELATWDVSQLAADAVAGLDLKPFWTDEEIAALQSAAAAAEVVGMAGARAADTEEPAAVDPEHAMFSCPLTLDQERVVRAALGQARRIYGVTTTGDALTRALTEWTESVDGRETPDTETPADV